MSIRLAYLIFLLLLPASMAWAQADTTAVDSTVVDSLSRPVRPDTTAYSDTVATDSLRPAFKVYPWKHNNSLASSLVSTDSTLRWQVWPSWVDKKNRDPGVFTYRLGTIGRTNALRIYSHGPRYQQLMWEDMNMNNPVTGMVNWDVIPLHKINYFYEENEGINHESSFNLKQYYLNRPLSQLIYKESKFNMRSLEFLVSRNFTSRTNAEISYWNRKDGGEYPNSDVSGRQIFARVFHQLDHQQALKVHFLNTQYTAGEPFGYGITDLSRFSFNHFQTTPLKTSAESETTLSNLSLNYYRRNADTTRVKADNFHAGLFLNSRERALTYNIDSTFYKVQSVGVSAHKWLDLEPLQLEGRISNEWFFNRDRAGSSLNIGSWNLTKGEASAVIRPVSFLSFGSDVSFSRRSDGYDSYSINVESGLQAGRFVRISGGLSKGTIMPTLQQLHWVSLDYSGNRDLEKEQVESAYAKVSFGIMRNLDIGLRGQVKNIENGIMVEDSLFTNVGPYGSASVSAYFDYSNRNMELSGSASYHKFGHFINAPGTPLPVDGNERVWLKGGAYVKGYLFNRATYVKAGLSGMISPLRYKPEHYFPVLDYWQPVSDDQYLPSFSRLDLDISARVRTIMVTLRWENILDDVAQLGYFETAQYPMGQRRFIFGVRAYFRD